MNFDAKTDLTMGPSIVFYANQKTWLIQSLRKLLKTLGGESRNIALRVSLLLFPLLSAWRKKNLGYCGKT